MMIGQWFVFIATGQVPELESEVLRILFHLAGEGITAIGLVWGGVSLLRKDTYSHAIYLLFSGMLLYSIIVSPGYFAQLGQWEFVAMFAILCILTIISTVAVAKDFLSQSVNSHHYG
jgi:hypothetical protein